MGCGASSASEGDRSSGSREGTNSAKGNVYEDRPITIPKERACVTASREFLERTNQMPQWDQPPTNSSPKQPNFVPQLAVHPPIIFIVGDTGSDRKPPSNPGGGPPDDASQRSGITPDATTKTMAPTTPRGAGLDAKHVKSVDASQDASVDSFDYVDGDASLGGCDTHGTASPTPNASIHEEHMMRRKVSDMPGAARNRPPSTVVFATS